MVEIRDGERPVSRRAGVFNSASNIFIQNIAANQVPKDIAPLLADSQDLCIPKKDKRECFTNLAAKCTLSSAKNQTNVLFEGVNDALTGSNKMGELVSLSSNHLRRHNLR